MKNTLLKFYANMVLCLQGHTEKQTQKKVSKTESTGGKQDSDTDKKKV